MSLANAEALCDLIRTRWPHARVAPGQVTGVGEFAGTVQEAPRECVCGTTVFRIRKPAETDGRWYALGGHELKWNGWSRISYSGHNRARCEAARAERSRIVIPGRYR